MRGDPGPCPVDDAPHTTCVAPNSGPNSGLIVVQQLGARDRTVVVPLVSRVIPPLKPTEFTTATYRRRPRGTR